jgi:hypothetical protein
MLRAQNVTQEIDSLTRMDKHAFESLLMTISNTSFIATLEYTRMKIDKTKQVIQKLEVPILRKLFDESV